MKRLLAVTPAASTPSSAPATSSPQHSGHPMSAEYCAKNQDPGCPPGSYIGADAVPSPNGDGTWVPCEGTICTNPNHGAGPDPTSVPVVPTTTPVPSPPPVTTSAEAGPVAGAPCEGDGHWVHLEGSNAEHYGTEWLCQH
ncbi:hypothetical protein ACFVMC_13440 [Nocardia sp. NPDC127579]|uniref:hypothetical protein n=1 Tax=Nocardia sp. NPDC127579 TaxID=3345402 RepID=UPI003642E5AC